MYISKEDLLSIVCTQSKQLCIEKNFKKHYPEHYQEVLKINFPEDFKFSQKLFHYLYDDPELKLGVCPICGKRCVFRRFGRFYTIYCSTECAKSDTSILEKRRTTCRERYGVDNYTQTEEFKEKSKDTCRRLYGVDNYTQTKECQEKRKNTCKEIYGVEHPSQSEKCKQKQKDTCIKKYGVDNYAKTKECHEKMEKTCIERYGVDNYSSTQECREKVRNTFRKNFGVDHYSQTDEYKIQVKNTCQEKWGVDNYAQTEECQEKMRNTCQERFGVNHYSLTDECKQKQKDTCKERYGVDHYSKTTEFAHRRRKQISYKDYLTFDSSWELMVYQFCEENNIPCEYQPNIQFTYEYDGKTHIYQPDFLINGKLYEVKGDHFFDGDKMINPFNRNQDDFYEAKHQCMIENNIRILRNCDISNLDTIFKSAKNG